jgi:hypothetical protein
MDALLAELEQKREKAWEAASKEQLKEPTATEAGSTDPESV